MLGMARKTTTPTVEETPNVRLDPKTGRFYWAVFKTLADDQGIFRKGGSTKTLDDAISKRDKALAEFAAFEAGNRDIALKGMKFEDFAKQCVEEIWPEEIGERTVIGYDDILRLHVNKRVGAVRLPKLTYDHVAGIDKALKDEGKSPQTRKNVRNCISKVFSTAQRVGRVGKDIANPAAMLIVKSEIKRDDLGNKIEHKRTLTPLEMKALLDKAKGNHCEGTVMLGLYAGLRIGEIVGLTWANCNLDKSLIHVVQQRQYIRGKGIKVKAPKTSAGERKIPIAAPLLAWLTDAKEKAKETSTQRYVVVDVVGKEAKADTVTQWFKDLVTDAGLCKVTDEHGALLPDPTPHDLRHTFGHYCANGWPIRLDDDGNIVERSPSTPITTLATLMGHSSITVTAEYYVATSTGDMQLAMSYIPSAVSLLAGEQLPAVDDQHSLQDPAE